MCLKRSCNSKYTLSLAAQQHGELGAAYLAERYITVNIPEIPILMEDNSKFDTSCEICLKKRQN